MWCDLGGFGRRLQRVNADDLLVSRDLYEHERALGDAQRHAQVHCCKYTRPFTHTRTTLLTTNVIAKTYININLHEINENLTKLN